MQGAKFFTEPQIASPPAIDSTHLHLFDHYSLTRLVPAPIEKTLSLLAAFLSNYTVLIYLLCIIVILINY